jgi:hypothetical protein
MDPRETPSTALRALRAPAAASLMLMSASVFGLGGCQVIKGIFEAGFGIGVIVVVAMVAAVGGVVAVIRK